MALGTVTGMSGTIRGGVPIEERIVVDFKTTFLLDAGAGTGKTQLLVNRLLGILRSGRSSLNRIAVITFTEKAAEELRVRTRRELEAIQQAGEQPRPVSAPPPAATRRGSESTWRACLRGGLRATRASP